MIKKILLLTLLFAGILNATNVTVSKNTYNPNEQIRVHFSGMTAKNKDWIGIYPANKNNDWDNVVAWKWTEDTTAGDLTFAGLPAGTYDVRAFYNNSFHLEAHKQFTVGANNGVTTVTTNKDHYVLHENVTVNFTNMSQDPKDWLGIYPAGSTNDWDNVLGWRWTDGQKNGHVTFTNNNVPAGTYEVRVFFRNSFELEARHVFTVGDVGADTTVTTNKATYTVGETVKATFNHMSGDAKDWMGIYPAGSTNDWDNVVAWKWTDGKIQGSKNFQNLPAGNYEVRVFFRNSFELEARHAFKVEGAPANTTVTTDKATYAVGETVKATFNHMSGDAKDWMGIYPAGSTNDWDNVIQWKWTDGQVQGTKNFQNLPAGNYEVRVFFRNSFELEARHAFKVEGQVVEKIVYETAENGLDQVWDVNQDPDDPHPVVPVKVINKGAQGSTHAARVHKDLTSTFSFNHPDKKFKFLELDVGAGISSHVGNFAVYIDTTKGWRKVQFSVYMNHPGNVYHNDPARFQQPFISDDGRKLYFPAPSDYFMLTADYVPGETNPTKVDFVHYKINIEEKLHLLEPDNQLLGITVFSTAGGDFDNIQLVSQ